MQIPNRTLSTAHFLFRNIILAQLVIAVVSLEAKRQEGDESGRPEA